MRPFLSCKSGFLGAPAASLPLFPDFGLFHAEVPIPADGDYASLASLASRCGVTIASLASPLDLGSDEGAERFGLALDGASGIGVGRIFVSAKAADGTPEDVALGRLTGLCRRAEERGVLICMETHPPFGHNADRALRTLESVGSPALRCNYDTANIHYYNEGANAAEELRRLASCIGSVHLKDTDGGYRSAFFPVFGEGTVDFPGVFAVLKRVGFLGPYTLELEGDCLRGLERPARIEFLRRCLTYLREIADFG